MTSKRTKFGGIGTGTPVVYSSQHGLFSSGQGKHRIYLFTTAPWYVLMDEGIKHILLAGGVYSNSTGNRKTMYINATTPRYMILS
jgi:hypothetical protein